jgi:aryl-alcohol dehydrogenase-like predicted oxidoreductase
MTQTDALPAAAAGTFRIGGDLPVSRLGFGAMRLTGLGIWGPPADHDGAIAVLKRVVALGVTLIDTADSYGPHVSESLIAEALHPYPADLVIATKGGYRRTGPNLWTPQGTPAHLRAACEGSLTRLRLERIDLYQLHAPDPKIPYEESVGALADLQREGKIRHIGLSNVSVDHITRARKHVTVVSVQNRYSPQDRASDDVLAYCAREGIAFLPWGPIGFGKGLQGAAIERVARAHQATPIQVGLAWLLARAPVVLPIPGTSSTAHVEENVAAATIALTDDEVRAIAKG